MKIAFGWIVLGFWIAFAGPLWAGQINVTGVGRVDAQPDMATITLGVTSQARTASAALSENSDAQSEVISIVSAAGVEDRDMQTSGLSLSPVWNNRNSNNAQPQIAGYTASNQISVRVRDLDELGVILDKVVRGGATNFNGLSFGLQDPLPASDLARERAVKDAIRKARLIASAAGVELGEIAEISEASAQARPQVFAREMAMSAAVPIAQGEVSVSASVNVVFEIAE